MGKNFKALNFAFELGFIVLVPIIILGVLGRMIDNYLSSSPFGLLIGVMLSIIISSLLVYKKSVGILNDQ